MSKDTLYLLAVFSIAAALLLVTHGGPVPGAQAAVLGGSWSPLTVTQGFALGLELSPEAGPGARVTLRLALRNVTPGPRAVAVADAEFDYRVILRDASGEAVKPIREAEAWGNVVLLVAPGEELTADYHLARMYGPLPDGQYSLVARRSVPKLDAEGKDEVESNPIVIVVSGGRAVVSGDTSGPLTVTQGFALRLELPAASAAASVNQPQAAPGDRVMLRFALRNVTSEPLLVAAAHPEYDYRLTVTDAHGEMVAPIREVLDAWGCVVLEVAPGEEVTADYDLTSMYGPLPDGEYSVVARRYVFRLDGEGTDEVESNPIAIVVSGGQTTQIASRPSGGGTPGTAKGAGPQLARGPDLLAARPILERHGFRVAWDAAKQAMTASRGKVVATIQAHKNVMLLGRQQAPMGKPARIVKGRLSAPGQAISMITSLGGGEAAA